MRVGGVLKRQAQNFTINLWDIFMASPGLLHVFRLAFCFGVLMQACSTLKQINK